MRKILFRADAKPSIGTGDLISLIELSKRLPQNWKFYFCCRQTNAAQKILKKRGVEMIHWLEDDMTIEHEKTYLKSIIAEDSIDAFIMEITEISPTEYEGIGADTYKVCINFCNDFPNDTDLLVDWSVEAPDWYHVDLYPKIKFLLGAEYVLIPEEIEKNFHSRPYAQRKIQNILITMGGNDQWNLSLSVLNALQRLKFEGNIKLVLGAGYMHSEPLQAFITESELSLDTLNNVPSMAKLYAWADLAIATGGLTASELVASRTPALVTAAYPHEESRCKLFRNNGWIEYSGAKNMNSVIINKCIKHPPPTASFFPFKTSEISNAIQRALK